jgi:hypothetical protein
VENVLKMEAGKTFAKERARAFLKASADQAESNEPGNPYSQSLYQVLSLLEKGLSLPQVRQQLRRQVQ